MCWCNWTWIPHWFIQCVSVTLYSAANCCSLSLFFFLSSYALFPFAFPLHIQPSVVGQNFKGSGKQQAREVWGSNWSTENKGLFKRTLFRVGLIRKQEELLSEGHQIPWGESTGSRGNLLNCDKYEGHFKLFRVIGILPAIPCSQMFLSKTSPRQNSFLIRQNLVVMMKEKWFSV